MNIIFYAIVALIAFSIFVTFSGHFEKIGDLAQKIHNRIKWRNEDE